MNAKPSVFVLVAIGLLGGVLAFGQSGSGPADTPFGEGEYRLGPEDVLDVHVWREEDLSTSAVVRPDGNISLPLSGELRAMGRTAKEIQDDITERLSAYITEPVVTVIVREVNSPKISVLGEVHAPGVFPIKNRITALDAIALAGGFTEFADRDNVVLIRETRSGTRRYRLDLEQMVNSDRGETVHLEPGDVVYAN